MLRITEKRLLSSPSQRQFESFACGTGELLASGELTALQLNQLETKVKSQQKARIRGHNKTSIQKFGDLTGEEASLWIANKEAQKEADLQKKRDYIQSVTRNRIAKKLKARGIIARRKEKERRKQLQELQQIKAKFIPMELFEPVPDPQKLTTQEDLNLQLQEALITMPEFSGVSFEYTEYEANEDAIDPTLEFSTQQDYISLEGVDIWDNESIQSGDGILITFTII
jgi:hypothetical protein